MLELVGPPGAPVIVVLGGISSSRHVTSSALDARPGWWSDFVGPRKTIDTNHVQVLGIDYCTSSVATTTHDQAAALASALDLIAVKKVRAIVGASYGGMVALAFGALFPERVERLVVIGAAHESAPIATALRILQRKIVELGIATGRGSEAVAIARGVAMTSYSSAQEFRERFDCVAEVDRFLNAAGWDFAARCTPERFLKLSQSLDQHKVIPEEIRVPVTLIAVEEDALVPLYQARELALRIGGACKLIEISSAHGHDTFLKAPSLIAPYVELS
jgi:homoserine O-acetyltransferase